MERIHSIVFPQWFLFFLCYNFIHMFCCIPVCHSVDEYSFLPFQVYFKMDNLGMFTICDSLYFSRHCFPLCSLSIQFIVIDQLPGDTNLYTTKQSMILAGCWILTVAWHFVFSSVQLSFYFMPKSIFVSAIWGIFRIIITSLLQLLLSPLHFIHICTTISHVLSVIIAVSYL